MSTLISMNTPPSNMLKRPINGFQIADATTTNNNNKINNLISSHYPYKYQDSTAFVVKNGLKKGFEKPIIQGLRFQSGPQTVLKAEKKTLNSSGVDKAPDINDDNIANGTEEESTPKEEEVGPKGLYKHDKYMAQAREITNRLETFNPIEHLPENFGILICAKRGSGKTFLLRDLLYPFRNQFKKVYLFAGTAHLQHSIEDDPFFFVPKDNIFKNFDENALLKIIEDNQKVRLENNQRPKREKKNNKVLIILDDLINDPAVTNSKGLKDLATKGRHSDISFILISQVLTSRGGFHTAIRTNIDCYISFMTYDKSTKELVSQCYLSLIDTKLGECLLNTVPAIEPYTALVVVIRHADKDKHVLKYEDFVYKYKAKEVRNYIIGEDAKVKHISTSGIRKKFAPRMTYLGSKGPRFNITIEED